MAVTNRRLGFTLVEAVMTAAVAGVVGITAASLFFQVSRFQRSARARAEVQRDARVSLELIEREAAQGRGHTIVIDRLDASQPPYSRLTFSTFDGRTVSFYQQGQTLFQSVTRGGATSTTRLARGLREALFSYPRSDDPSLLAIALTFERSTYQSGSKSLELSLAKVRVQNGDAY